MSVQNSAIWKVVGEIFFGAESPEVWKPEVNPDCSLTAKCGL
jgi:hypothetical protein